MIVSHEGNPICMETYLPCIVSVHGVDCCLQLGGDTPIGSRQSRLVRLYHLRHLAVTLQHSLQHSLVTATILIARRLLLLLLQLFQLHEVTLREVPHQGTLRWQPKFRCRQSLGGISSEFMWDCQMQGRGVWGEGGKGRQP